MSSLEQFGADQQEQPPPSSQPFVEWVGIKVVTSARTSEDDSNLYGSLLLSPRSSVVAELEREPSSPLVVLIGSGECGEVCRIEGCDNE